MIGSKQNRQKTMRFHGGMVRVEKNRALGTCNKRTGDSISRKRIFANEQLRNKRPADFSAGINEPAVV
jgi:hypothetical protein